jgi:hypothetical protein
MRRAEAILTAALTLSLSGCVLGGKPKTVQAAPPPKPAPAPAPAPAAPAPLSIPQTQVQLPPPQPINPDALAPNPPEEPVGGAPTPPRNRNRGGQTGAPRDTTPAVSPPAPAPAPEPTRPKIEEIVPAAEQKQLQESASAQRRDVRQILDKMRSHRLNANQKTLRTSIESFLGLSEQAEKRNDMRSAQALAERALVLARELQGGK